MPSPLSAFRGMAEFEISKGIEDALVAMLTFLGQFRFAFDEVPHAFTDGLVGFIPVRLEDFSPFLVPLAFGGLLITGLKIDPGLFAAYRKDRKNILRLMKNGTSTLQASQRSLIGFCGVSSGEIPSGYNIGCNIAFSDRVFSLYLFYRE